MKYDNKFSSQFIEILYCCGLYPAITRPTRVTDISATLIDNIFTNNISENQFSGIICTDISDHLPVCYVNEQKGISKPKKLYKMLRKFDEKRIEDVCTQLKNASLEELLNEYDTNVAYDKLWNKFLNVYNTCYPPKRVFINSRLHNKPWMTKGLSSACKKRIICICRGLNRDVQS